MIELSGLNIRVADFVLGPIDLTIDQGEHVLLVGPSGAGKSLLLEAIAGFRPLVSGHVRLRGKDVDGVPTELRRCAWMSQAQTLFPHMSVRQNIEYGLRCVGIPKSERDENVSRWAQRMGIGTILDRKTPTLSGGEKQRVALARSLATGDDILLLDEPFSSVERGRRNQLWRLISDLHTETGVTIVHVTHDTERAMSFKGRAVVLADGKVVQSGTVRQLHAAAREPAIAQTFGQYENLPATIDDAVVNWVGDRFAAGPLLQDATSGPVWLEFSASDVEIGASKPGESFVRLAGVVTSIERVHGSLRVGIETADGGRLHAMMERSDAIPSIGEATTATIPAAAIAVRPRT